MEGGVGGTGQTGPGYVVEIRADSCRDGAVARREHVVVGALGAPVGVTRPTVVDHP